jgi:hypothetical protein
VIKTLTVATCAESNVEIARRVMATGEANWNGAKVSMAMREALKAVWVISTPWYDTVVQLLAIVLPPTSSTH